MSNSESPPLVTIGIPTFNRANTLPRAIESALRQEYQNLEIVISDNASTDHTERVAKDYLQRDRRIRYIKQSTNCGPTLNFNSLLTHASGEFFLWLADDDCLERDYVGACVAYLREHTDVVLAAGVVHFESSTGTVAGYRMRLLHKSPRRRLLSYLWRVCDNSVYYGVMRRSMVGQCTVPNVVAGDWLFISSLAFRGKIETITQTSLRRAQGGTSASAKNIARILGLSRWQGIFPWTFVAKNMWKGIARLDDTYARVSSPGRVTLATAAALSILVRKGIGDTVRRSVGWMGRAIFGATRYESIKHRLERR